MRPVRWIVAMLDGEVIPLEFAGIKAGNQSRGHRILGPAQVSIASPSQYAETMQGAHVTVLSGDREYKIRKALDAATRTVPGARWREDAELLKTVVNLTEWPSAILGSFDKAIFVAAGRSAGHGDARPPEIFCRRRCCGQAGAAFSGRTEY